MAFTTSVVTGLFLFGYQIVNGVLSMNVFLRSKRQLQNACFCTTMQGFVWLPHKIFVYLFMDCNFLFIHHRYFYRLWQRFFFFARSRIAVCLSCAHMSCLPSASTYTLHMYPPPALCLPNPSSYLSTLLIHPSCSPWSHPIGPRLATAW